MNSRRTRTAARIGMSRTAGKMHPCYGQALRVTDPVTYWDLVASMNDYRAALCLATGVPVENIDRDGYNLTRPEARQYLADKRREYGARM